MNPDPSGGIPTLGGYLEKWEKGQAKVDLPTNWQTILSLYMDFQGHEEELKIH